MDMESGPDTHLVADWDHMFYAANVLLANITDEGAFHQYTQVLIWLMPWTKTDEPITVDCNACQLQVDYLSSN